MKKPTELQRPATMTLRELADAVRADFLTYEQVADEYRRRQREGLDPDTGKPLAEVAPCR